MSDLIIGQGSVVQVEAPSLSRVISKSTNYTLGTDATGELYDGMVLVTAAAVITLPPGATNMNACVMSTGANIISVDPDGADHFVLNGIALTAGHKITSSGLAGDTVNFFYAGANTWYVTPGNGVNWIDGG